MRRERIRGWIKSFSTYLQEARSLFTYFHIFTNAEQKATHHSSTCYRGTRCRNEAGNSSAYYRPLQKARHGNACERSDIYCNTCRWIYDKRSVPVQCFSRNEREDRHGANDRLNALEKARYGSLA